MILNKKGRELNCLKAEAVINILLYTYKGVRMWSRSIEIDYLHIDGMLIKMKRVLGV